MRTLNISISDIDFSKFGLRQEQLNFSELIVLIRKELMREYLVKSTELAKEYGFSYLTMDEISSEVNAVRTHAKSNH